MITKIKTKEAKEQNKKKTQKSAPNFSACIFPWD